MLLATMTTGAPRVSVIQAPISPRKEASVNTCDERLCVVRRKKFLHPSKLLAPAGPVTKELLLDEAEAIM